MGRKSARRRNGANAALEMKQILEYYFAGIAPPPPGNVKGKEIKSQMVMDGKVKYRLIHLTFGPKESLSLDIGVFTPVTGGPVPALIMPGGTPPGATASAAFASGTRTRTGVDALLTVGPGNPNPQATPARAGACTRRCGNNRGAQSGDRRTALRL